MKSRFVPEDFEKSFVHTNPPPTTKPPTSMDILPLSDIGICTKCDQKDDDINKLSVLCHNLIDELSANRPYTKHFCKSITDFLEKIRGR